MDVWSAARAGHARSTAILIGVANTTDYHLQPGPAALNSLRAMNRVLTDPSLCGWPADRVTVMRNPDNSGQTAHRLRQLMLATRDVLVVYYVGHSRLTADGSLCLAVNDTMAEAPDAVGLGYPWLAQTLGESPARLKVAILDCSFPARAADGPGPITAADSLAELTQVAGVYTLAAPRNSPAQAAALPQQRSQCTSFTGQLVALVETGIPGGPPNLTLDDIYPRLHQQLVALGLTPPTRRGGDSANRLVFTRNAAAPTPGPTPGLPPIPASGPAPRNGPTPAAPPPRRRSRRRILVVAAALAAAVVVPVLVITRPPGGPGAEATSQGEVDLRDLADQTISLGPELRPTALAQDEATLWVQSDVGTSGSQLTRVNLLSGEVAGTVPFPGSDSVGVPAVGAGSLWVAMSSTPTANGSVVRINPVDGTVDATVELLGWPGQTVFAAGALWVATVEQPVAEELGADPRPFSASSNGLTRIDPATNQVAAFVPLPGVPLDVRATDDLVFVSTEGPDGTSVVVVDPATDRQVEQIPVSGDRVRTVGADSDAPWNLFATDPYAVRVDVDAQAVSASAGPRDGVTMVVPNGEHLWELRADTLTVLDRRGEALASVTVDGTPLAASSAGLGAAWIVYTPAGSSDVLVSRVSLAALVRIAESPASP